MDIPTLLFGSGFALFLVLLAWGNRIREPRKDIRELEDQFIRSFKTTKRRIKPLIRETYEKIEGSSIESFIRVMDSFIEIMDHVQTHEDATLIDNFKKVTALRNRLEELYKKRYILTFTATILSLLLGIFSLYNGSINLPDPIQNIYFDQIYLSAFYIFIFIILLMLIKIYIVEEKFILLIDETYDLVEEAS